MDITTVTGVLESLGIPYALGGWAPSKPPASGPYSLIIENTMTIGGDDYLDVIVHRPRLILYDDGLDGDSVRSSVGRGLAKAGIGFTMDEPDYFYEEKVFQTVFNLSGWYEKGIAND